MGDKKVEHTFAKTWPRATFIAPVVIRLRYPSSAVVEFFTPKSRGIKLVLSSLAPRTG